jgi:putative SOS response-associated peptidase YedK
MQRIAEAFHLGKLPDGFVLPPDYNVAPTTFQSVIRADKETGERELVTMRWGMGPVAGADAQREVRRRQLLPHLREEHAGEGGHTRRR